MFLSELNEQQKYAFLTLASRITQADGEDSADEQEALDELCAEMQIEHRIDMKKVLGAVDVAPFDNRRSRILAALELMRLVYADDYLHEAEVAEVTKICRAFGFTPDWIALMAEWARRYSWTEDDPADSERADYQRQLVAYADKVMSNAP